MRRGAVVASGKRPSFYSKHEGLESRFKVFFSIKIMLVLFPFRNQQPLRLLSFQLNSFPPHFVDHLEMLFPNGDAIKTTRVRCEGYLLASCALRRRVVTSTCRLGLDIYCICIEMDARQRAIRAVPLPHCARVRHYQHSTYIRTRGTALQMPRPM